MLKIGLIIAAANYIFLHLKKKTCTYLHRKQGP